MNNFSDKPQFAIQDLIQLLETGENEQIEFKKSFDKEAIESLSSFANTKGGSVLIGVEDSGVVKGVSVGKETLQNWNNQIKQSCTPSILPDTDIISYEDKKIVVLSIPEYPVKPICCKGKYYKRVNNSNHQMTLSEIADLHFKTLNTSWDHYPDSNHKLNTISLQKVNNFISLSNKSRPFPLADSPLSVLKNMSF
jgi:ATP-dependent DNA helicase RecG